MNEASVKSYAQEADRRDRDPVGPDGTGRAQVVNGRGFKNWRRFHAGEATVWVENNAGQRYELTPNQYRIYRYVSSCYGTPIQMRSVARRMKLAASTVSRAMVKLASFGLIAYLTGRGRSAVTVVIERVKNDGMDRFRRAAKAKVSSWRIAAERRVSRLQTFVAPYAYEGRGRDSLTDYLYTLPSVKSATIRQWTPEDMRDLDREMGCVS